MLTIDGSFGEGGGQIVRSSLALALVTARPVKIEQIRAGRRKPGLLRQHLTALRAAARIGSAEVEGDRLGSLRLVFRPGHVTPGKYDFRVGTAGSATLVLQTVLPALLTVGGESTIRLEGGTHNPFAPPFDFLARAYLPLVERMGPRIEATLVRPGFYPAGGGEFLVAIRPAESWSPLELTERGSLKNRRVRALISRLPRHIAERECRTIAETTAWPPRCFEIEEISDARGAGNVVLVELEFENVTEVICGFGAKGVRAEQVAQRVCAEVDRLVASNAAVGTYLADQLILPMGIGAHLGGGGGLFRTLPLSPHATTHIELLKRFLEVEIAVQTADNCDTVVRIGRAAR